MPDTTQPEEHKLTGLLDSLIASWYWKLFFALLAVISGAIGVKGNVGADVRNFALGVLTVAALIVLFLLVVDIIHWLSQNAYQRSSAYQFNAKLYGLGYESLKIAALLNRDGSMTITRQIRLKAFTDGVSKIDHYMFAREAPRQGQAIQARIIGRKSESITPQLTIEHQSSDRFMGVVTFPHSLKRGDVVEYPYEETLPPGSFALTKRELEERRMPFEFVAWDIVRPTKNFTLKVRMTPETPIENPDHDAWFGQTRSSHEKEYRDTHGGWNDDQSEPSRELILDVPQPILGLTYAIKWTPAAQAQDAR